MGEFFVAITNNKNYLTTLGDLTGYNLIDASIFSVP